MSASEIVQIGIDPKELIMRNGPWETKTTSFPEVKTPFQLFVLNDPLENKHHCSSTFYTFKDLRTGDCPGTKVAWLK